MLNSRRRSFVAVAAFLIFATLSAFAQSATIREMQGEVNLKSPGRDWTQAAVGSEVRANTILSTGFGATALLDLGDSEILVRPLTRMRLDEIVRQEGTAKTSMFLHVGRVRAKVKTTEGLEHDFVVRSPVSTAAVRGTEFEFNGYQVIGFEGMVTQTNQAGVPQTIAQGETGSTGGVDQPEGPEEQRRKRSQVQPATTRSGEPAIKPEFRPPEAANVTIELRWDF
jgi:hypothetical protein